MKRLKLRLDVKAELGLWEGDPTELLLSDIKSVDGRWLRLNISIKTTRLRDISSVYLTSRSSTAIYSS